MESTNDNSAVPTLAAAVVADANTTPTSASSSSSSSSFSSDLVTRTKLLTREEECTLKTALAFVVIKTRAKAKERAKAAAAVASGSSNKKQRIIADSSTEAKDFSESTAHYESISILDHLFCHRRRSSNGYSNNEQRQRERERDFSTPNQPKPFPSRSLECSGGRTHIDHMFRAAKTLAETWLVTNRTQQQQHLRRDHPPTATTATKALVGATGHLAHQLQLLLVAAVNHPTSNGASSISISISTSTSTNSTNHKKSTAKQPVSVHQSPSLAKQRDRGKHALSSRARYRRPSLSSRSTADSTSTPSSFSQIAAGTGTATAAGTAAATTAVVVTPATNHRNSNSNKNKNDCNNEVERNPNNRTIETVFLVQEWIRSTLLQQDDHHQYTAAASTPATLNTETKVSRTILSCQTTTVLDVLASFHVYTVMIPQIARISPPLIGHVFQVVARLVKDLYSDKIAVVGEDAVFWAAGSSDNGENNLGRKRNARKLLDHLVTSALALLELCWTTEIAVGRSRTSKESHRSFLLLSLQEILGDLLVPLSRSELSGEHYRLTVSASRNRTLQELQQHRQHHQVLRRNQNSQGGFPLFSESQHHRQARQQQQQRVVLQRWNQIESKSEPTPQTFRKAPTDASACAREDTVNEKAAATKFQASRVVLSPPPPPPELGCLLDPEAKLLLRMAVYRLILMGKKG